MGEELPDRRDLLETKQQMQIWIPV